MSLSVLQTAPHHLQLSVLLGTCLSWLMLLALLFYSLFYFILTKIQFYDFLSFASLHPSHGLPLENLKFMTPFFSLVVIVTYRYINKKLHKHNLLCLFSAACSHMGSELTTWLWITS